MHCKQRLQAPSTSPPSNPTYGSAETNKPMKNMLASLQVIQSGVASVIHERRTKIGSSRGGLQVECWDAEEGWRTATALQAAHLSSTTPNVGAIQRDTKRNRAMAAILASSIAPKNFATIWSPNLQSRKAKFNSPLLLSFSLVSQTSSADDQIWMKFGERMDESLCHLPSYDHNMKVT